jgi:hypothetical protein
MSNSKPPYERLTRPRFGLNGTGSLWLGKDHLLLVNNTFAVERYRRWYFPDLQAVVMRRTSARLIWNLILGSFAVILFAGAGGCLYGSSTSTAPDDIIVLAWMAGVFGVIGFGFVAAAAANTAMGPTCTMYVQTPHGLDRLTTPNRIVTVEKLTARLQPALLAAQTQGGSQAGSLHEIAVALDQPLS